MQGFLVTVEGDFFGAPREGDRKKEKFPYNVQVRVPKAEGVLSLIKNKLLDKVLRLNYANYNAYRTHQITGITNLNGSKVYGLTDPRLMDFNDLAEHVKKNKLPLKLELYTDLGYFRTMVHLAETNQKEFLRKQDVLQRDFVEDKELAKLNPELLGASEPLKPSMSLKIPQSQNPQVLQTPLNEKQLDKIAVNAMTSAEQDKTTIIQGEAPKLPESPEGQKFGEVLDAPASALITEAQPQVQKVQKVYVEGKGYIDSKNFVEDFDKEGEKEFEVYDPTKLTPAPSEEGSGNVKLKIESAIKDTINIVDSEEGVDLIGEL